MDLLVLFQHRFETISSSRWEIDRQPHTVLSFESIPAVSIHYKT